MGQQKKAIAEAYEVRISDNALKNIDEITGYITFINKEPLNAVKVGDAIFRTIDRIGASPLAFRECSELQTKSKMYRRAVCLSWQIIYKVVGREVVVLGVIHGSRKPSGVRVLRRIR
jgi:plasmid stabilization system protein ParE